MTDQKDKDKQVDHSKRRFLAAATTVVGGVGLAAAAYPFAASWLPSQRAQAAGAPVEVDISKLPPGAQMTVEWRGRPIWIIHRSPEAIEKLGGHDDRLRDPTSSVDQQPAYAQNPHRSLKPQYLILVGLCTHLGCVPKYVATKEGDDVVLGADWPGGFFCPCHGSMFDLAGRVFQGVPAPINLEVPPHQFVSDKTVIIGIHHTEEV